MSMLRFANDTAPPSTEWVPLGWSYGSLSLQHRADSSSFVVLQVSPPTNLHQVALGKLSDLSEVSYHPTGDGPSQVVLESKVDLDSSLPYYFKVEAHHDMLQNRTIYEGLYSIGNHWMYMGSLVLQHPNKQGAGKDVKSGRVNSSESSETESNSESKEAESKSEETKSEETKSEETKSDVAKSNDSSSKETKNDNFKSRNDDTDKDQDDDAMSDKDEDDDDKDEKIKSAGDKVRRRHKAKPSGSSSVVEDDSESGSESDSDNESKSPSSATTPLVSLAPSKLAKRQLENDSSSLSAANSLRTKMRSAFTDFLKSGIKAIKPDYKKQSVSHSKRVAVSAASKDKGLVGDDELSLFKNGIDFPSFSVFPRLYSGVKRLEGGDPALVRAGVYKKFQLRDRLGETFFITQGRAFAYDGTDNDITLVRHYFLSSSYLISLDGPHPAASDDEKLKESSSSSSPLPSSSAGAESASSTTETTAAETASLS
ncbi:hypothetical protein IW152_001308 [Coemansia sp. BCRC 34962]|nr:hypothetical protein IW152_001308 [Coemansia sp. BCRC 34962]